MEKDQREACRGEEKTKCCEKPARFDISWASIFELNDKTALVSRCREQRRHLEWEHEPSSDATCEVSTSPLRLAPKGGPSSSAPFCPLALASLPTTQYPGCSCHDDCWTCQSEAVTHLHTLLTRIYRQWEFTRLLCEFSLFSPPTLRSNTGLTTPWKRGW